MILIYSHKITKRLNYIFRQIFTNVLGVKIEITAVADEFDSWDGAKICYDKKPRSCEIFFQAADLLFETGIAGQELHFIEFRGNVAFYPVYDKKSAFPFDPFAASFFLLTRYEEYLPYLKDKYNRFEATESIAYQKGFLHLPLVNIWAEEIKKNILKKYPTVKFRTRRFRFIPTIDIDSAFAYKHKGTVRTIGALLKAFAKFDFHEISERLRVFMNLRKDPFDTYDFQLLVQKKYNLFPIYFILFADYGEYDKNVAVNNKSFQRLIKSLADYAEVGIHPSFDSSTNSDRLKLETERLSRVLNREITKSRQHFLLLNFPSTYRNLINIDITDDYTMGYASRPGFRASICDSFHFYDLDLETETKLRIHPFQIMEGTLKDYMKLSNEKSLRLILELIDQVKAVNGTFISLWHNESLSNLDRWEGWHELYEEMIKYATRCEKEV
jgi:hypothetical protein